MTRKTLLLLMSLLCGLPLMAAQDTIDMVSYFPIPYASYGNMYLNNRLDMGTSTKCLLTVGTDTTESCPLATDTVNLNGGLAIGKVNEVSIKNIVLGRLDGNSYPIRDNIILSFGGNLRIQNISNPVESLHVGKLYINENDRFQLFPQITSETNQIPFKNSSAIIRECEAGAHWQQLKGTDDKFRTYLVCGYAKTAKNTKFIPKIINLQEAYYAKRVRRTVKTGVGGTPGHCTNWNIDEIDVESPGDVYAESFDREYVPPVSLYTDFRSDQDGCVCKKGATSRGERVVQGHRKYTPVNQYDLEKVPQCPSDKTDEQLCGTKCTPGDTCAYKCFKDPATLGVKGKPYASYTCDCYDNNNEDEYVGICGTGATVQSGTCLPEHSCKGGKEEIIYYEPYISNKRLLTCVKKQ